MIDVVVVGAGLAGLTAAVAIHAAGGGVTVVEARASIGGRMKTLTSAGGWLDLGATWHWENQPQVRALAAELGVDAFTQHRTGQAVVEQPGAGAPRRVDLAPPSPAEYRFAGGAQTLAHRLAARLPEGSVLLGTEVSAVSVHASGVTVWAAGAGGEQRLACDSVIVAVPPRLAWSGIFFSPALPATLAGAMRATPTWMATAVKCTAVYDTAFWRHDGLSGLAFSGVGPLTEVHDGCSPDGSTAALWGFLSANHDVRDLSAERRTALVLAQLGRLFGPEGADPVRYVERDWSNDPYTNDEVVWVGHPVALGHPSFSEPLFGGRLVWAGSETSAVGAGHMEGAVRSGQRAAAQVLARRG